MKTQQERQKETKIEVGGKRNKYEGDNKKERESEREKERESGMYKGIRYEGKGG